MTHPREEELALYSTGDLGRGALDRIASHLELCPRCRESLAQFQRLEHMLAAPAPEPCAADLQEVRRRVMFALPGASQPRWRFDWGLKELAAAAALIALVLFIRNLYSPARLPVEPAKPVSIELPAALPPSPLALRNVNLPRARRPRAPGVRSIGLVTRPDRGPLIEIATTDPHVIILLPAAPQNEERTQSNE